MQQTRVIGKIADAELQMQMLDAICDDDARRLLDILGKVDDVNAVLTIASNIKLPHILRNRPLFAAVAAFLGSVESFRVFMSLAFDHEREDDRKRRLVHFVASSGSFEVCREVDGLGVDWSVEDQTSNMAERHCLWDRLGEGRQSGRGKRMGVLVRGRSPADYAAAFGHVPIIQWLLSVALFQEG